MLKFSKRPFSRRRPVLAPILMGISLLLAPSTSWAQGLVAFPEAEGAGHFTTGGRSAMDGYTNLESYLNGLVGMGGK